MKQYSTYIFDRDGEFYGKKLLLRFEVGSEYDGHEYTVTIEKGDELIEFTGIVWNGYITFFATNEASSITVDLP